MTASRQRTGPVAAALALLLAAGAADAAAPRPHVLLVVADDLGWNDVGYHGGDVATPTLDRLAEQGVALERFYALPSCTATRASLLTGRYAIRHGLQGRAIGRNSEAALPADERTLAQALREAGYRTALVGKWHLGRAERRDLPTQRGFDHHYGFYNAAVDYDTHRNRGGALDWFRNEQPVHEPGYATHLLAREAERLIAAHDPSTPLFLYLAFNAPHAVLKLPPAARGRSLTRRERFALVVNDLDGALGRVVDALDRAGMRDDTLILFLSDNGADPRLGGSNAPLRDGKRSAYEGGVRVPALASWPGHLPAGRRVAVPLHVVDVYPTLLGLAGADPAQPHPVDGIDAWPLIAGTAPAGPERTLLLDAVGDEGAVLSGDWKLVVRRRDGAPDGAPLVHELFDLARDPGETHDLAAQHPERVRALAERFAAYAAQAVPRPGGHPLAPGGGQDAGTAQR